MANGYGTGNGSMTRGVNRRTTNRAGNRTVNRSPNARRQVRTQGRNPENRTGFPSARNGTPFYQPLSSARAQGGFAGQRVNPNRRINPSTVPAGSNGNVEVPVRFIIKQTGEAYNGRVMEHGGRMVTTTTGAYEGNSREVVGTNKPININPITNTPYSNIQDAAFRANPNGAQNRTNMDIQIGAQQPTSAWDWVTLPTQGGGNQVNYMPPQVTVGATSTRDATMGQELAFGAGQRNIIQGEGTVGGTVMGGTATGPSGVRRLSDIPSSGY